MKITSVAVLKWNGFDREPYILGIASDVSSFGYFQRTTVREMLTFVSRMLVQRTRPGMRQSVEHEGYMCHSHNRDGLACIAVTDHEYPRLSAFSVVNKVLDEFVRSVGDVWRTQQADAVLAQPMVDAALLNYQDPAKADTLYKVQQDLDETKIILHKTIESVLDRGEKLDNLVAKSGDLSASSQIFYKQARKANSCCTFM